MTVYETTTSIEELIKEYNRHTLEIILQGIREHEYSYFEEYEKLYDYLRELDYACEQMYGVSVYRIRDNYITMNYRFESRFKDKKITFIIDDDVL